MTAWNGMAISAYALASRALTQEQPPATRCFPVDGRPPKEYLQAALKVTACALSRILSASAALCCAAGFEAASAATTCRACHSLWL